MPRFPAVVLTFALFALGSTPAGPSAALPIEDPEVERILENARRAAGFDALRASTGAFRVTGRVDSDGASGDYSLRFSGRGRFVKSLTGGEDSETRFDGESLWRTEGAGPVCRLDLEEEDVELLKVLLPTGLWLAPDSPFRVTLDRDGSTADAISLRLSSRDGPFSIDVVLDRVTFRLASAHRRDPGAPVTWTYSDHRLLNGLAFPFHSTYSNPEGTTALRIGSIDAVEALSDADLAPRTGRPADTTFLESVAADVPIRWTDRGQILVRPRIDGSEPGFFLLDTGAAALFIDASLAARLGWAELGPTTAVHATGRTRARYRRGSSFELGPLRIAKPTYATLDLNALSERVGVELAGICGYDLFARAVVELDVNLERIRIFDPATFSPRDGAWQPLRFQRGRPCVECGFGKGRRSLFLFDTGYSGFVLFHSPTVNALGLLRGQSVREMLITGLEGEKPLVGGTIARFEIGGREYGETDCGFFLSDEGPHADPYLAGTVGSAWFGEFRIVLDYSRARIGFLPPSAKPEGGR